MLIHFSSALNKITQHICIVISLPFIASSSIFFVALAHFLFGSSSSNWNKNPLNWSDSTTVQRTGKKHETSRKWQSIIRNDDDNNDVKNDGYSETKLLENVHRHTQCTSEVNSFLNAWYNNILNKISLSHNRQRREWIETSEGRKMLMLTKYSFEALAHKIPSKMTKTKTVIMIVANKLSAAYTHTHTLASNLEVKWLLRFERCQCSVILFFFWSIQCFVIYCYSVNRCTWQIQRRATLNSTFNLQRLSTRLL